MVNRKMKFLNERCLRGWHANANIRQSFELSTRCPGHSQDGKASSAGDFSCPANIGGISRRAQRTQHITSPAQREHQLGENVFRINVIADAVASAGNPVSGMT